MNPRWMLAFLLLGCSEVQNETQTPLDQGPSMDSTHVPDVEGQALDEGVPDARPGDVVVSRADASNGPVDCDPISDHPDWRLCSAEENRCTAVFEDGAGCEEVCAAVGLRCVESYEDIDGECAPDRTRPALGCAPGHRSDYCVCQRGACQPDCEGRTCGSNGCGGRCGDCEAGQTCRDGACMRRPPIACGPDDCPAFPGAEGEGRNARGGRGGDVCRVTSLDDDGPGTLRRCLTTADGPRTIVFNVAGYITLDSTIRVRRSNLTIAGQTAPGDGVTIRDWGVVIEGDHIIVQHLRFRAGDRQKATRERDGFTEDSLSVTGDDVMVDHVSASWGIDENLSSGPSAFRRVTIQYSIIAEGLHRTRLFHGEYDADHPGHSMGGLYKSREGDSTISIHHNLFAHNNNRNPAIGNYDANDSFDADIRNNVIYGCRNMGYVSGASRRVRVNYVGNYGILGDASRSEDLFRGNEDSNVQIFQQGNRVDTNRNGRFDGRDLGWRMFGDEYRAIDEPTDLTPVTTESAEAALERVLNEAGARPWSRDRTDLRVVEDVRAGTGALIDSQSDVGGWGELSPGRVIVDEDGDGMGDDWERTHGCDPTRPDHNGDVDGDGYTNLENYLHWAARLGPRP